MPGERQGVHASIGEKAVTGLLQEADGEHLTLRSAEAGERMAMRVDDDTRFHWLEERDVGELHAGAILHVDYDREGDLRVAREVMVLLQGDGDALTSGLVPPSIH